MEKWQIYLYLFFVVTILHALYDKRTKLAVGACVFFAIVIGAIKYATVSYTHLTLPTTPYV